MKETKCYNCNKSFKKYRFRVFKYYICEDCYIHFNKLERSIQKEMVRSISDVDKVVVSVDKPRNKHTEKQKEYHRIRYKQMAFKERARNEALKGLSPKDLMALVGYYDD